MEKLTKILIVVVIVLVAGFSLCVGLLLGNYLFPPVEVVNNSTNSTNSSSQNNQTNQVTSNNSNNNYISEGQAISIAKSAWPVSGANYTISSYPTSDSPYYWVSVENNNYIGPSGFVKINAYTGEVVMKGT